MKKRERKKTGRSFNLGRSYDLDQSVADMTRFNRNELTHLPGSIHARFADFGIEKI